MKTRPLKVSDFADVYSGGTPSTSNPNYWDGDVAWITPKDMSSHTGVYIERGERSITKQGLRESSAYLLPADTVILSSRAPVGYVAVARTPLATNQGCKNLRCKGGVAHPVFIYYLLKSNTARLEAHATGSTYKELSASRLKNISFHLPEDINIQGRIASILLTYDDLIENNRRRIHLLEQAARLLYKEWFVHLRFPGHEHVTITNGVPEGWEKMPLGQVAPLNYGKALKQDDRIPGPFPVYGSSGILGTHEKALVTGPAIIVGRKGNVGSVYWSNDDFYPIDTVYFIEAEHCTTYLYYALLHTHFISTDVAVPGLNRGFAHSRKLLFPDEKILILFEQHVTVIHDQIVQLTKYNEALAQARDILLPRLMNGEVAV
jgi:type I restriction enzyme S subunit